MYKKITIFDKNLKTLLFNVVAFTYLLTTFEITSDSFYLHITLLLVNLAIIGNFSVAKKLLYTTKI